MSTDEECRGGFGPLTPRISSKCPMSAGTVPFDDVGALAAALEYHGPSVAAFIVEPIQGEAGLLILSQF